MSNNFTVITFRKIINMNIVILKNNIIKMFKHYFLEKYVHINEYQEGMLLYIKFFNKIFFFIKNKAAYF